jgi:iron complex outermembrane receptor protein
MKDKLHVSVQAAEQFVNDKGVFLPGINTSIEFLKWLEIKLNAQRTYRAPTLNELYYQPGGNAALKPEEGWAGEAGYYVQTNKSRQLVLSQGSSAFYRDIRDWIIWYGGAIWTPHNIARVRSRGVETENMLRWKTRAGSFHLGLNTAYVIATTIESYIPGDGSIGKQIPYAPRYKGQLNLGISYRGLYFNYNHTYTGYRFYTTDESAWIEPYSTANIQLSYLLLLNKGRTIQLSGQCNNLLNSRYQVVAQRPMPGVNWMVGARFHFGH